MLISLEQLRTILKSTGINIYRDSAPTKAKYPYIIYEFVNEQHRRASGRVIADMTLYQIAYITIGIETELEVIKQVLNDNKVSYSEFVSSDYDENDSRVTQFTSYVRCIHER